LCAGYAVFSIGEFSKIAGLSIKTLRFYHEEGLLAPALVDERTGYRYYDHGRVEKARTIVKGNAKNYLTEIQMLIQNPSRPWNCPAGGQTFAVTL
jgi:DNA-binding transcriptional MerR regulator